MADPQETAEDDEVGIHGMQAGQWVDLKKIQVSISIAAQVQAARVPASQLVPDLQRHGGGPLGNLTFDEGIGDSGKVVALVPVGVNGWFGRIAKEDFHDSQYTPLSCAAHHNDRELAAGQEGLNQTG